MFDQPNPTEDQIDLEKKIRLSTKMEGDKFVLEFGQLIKKVMLDEREANIMILALMKYLDYVGGRVCRHVMHIEKVHRPAEDQAGGNDGK